MIRQTINIINNDNIGLNLYIVHHNLYSFKPIPSVRRYMAKQFAPKNKNGL